MKFFDKFKDFVGVDSYDDDYYDDDDYIIDEVDTQERPRFSRAKEKVIPLESKTSIDIDLTITRPKSFSDATKFVDLLKQNRPVIINFDSLKKEEAQQILQFLSGATYALDGNVRGVAEQIYVFAPKNVELTSPEAGEEEDSDIGEGEEIHMDDDMWR